MNISRLSCLRCGQNEDKYVLGGMIMKRTAERVKLNRIRVEDPFWSPIQKLVTDVVIPYQEKILNDEIPGAEK